VTGISFEFSPGRGDPRFEGDFTAADIFIMPATATSSELKS